jgi:hypothetical protein
MGSTGPSHHVEVTTLREGVNTTIAIIILYLQWMKNKANDAYNKANNSL